MCCIRLLKISHLLLNARGSCYVCDVKGSELADELVLLRLKLSAQGISLRFRQVDGGELANSLVLRDCSLSALCLCSRQK